MKFLWTAIVFVVTAGALSADDSQPSSPLTPEQQRATFQLPPDLEIQLVAAEPDVADPVHISWDEAGRMFVCEMGDYPAEPAGGHIRLLEDRDGDGRIDHSHIFADDLHYPTSTLPWRGGVLVTAAPDILFLKDTDGDGVADVRKVLFTGFGEGNQQLRVNSLIQGLDGWIYGANGRSDGAVKCVGTIDGDIPPTATTEPVLLRSRDFRINLDLGVIEPTAGFSQFGHSFDDYGNRFLSWNTIHIRHVVLDPLRLGRSGHLSPQEACTEIADHGSTGRVYPASTTTKRFNAEEPGFFNASCGLTIYRGDALPAGYRGNAFACEPLSNLVHRDILRPDGVTFIASRAPTEQESEFLTSTDSWFRPVNLTTGPDGALYVVDFYRELVEHPQFVANVEARESTDFRKGHEYGRIWRIAAAGTPTKAAPNLAEQSVSDLVDRLASSNSWIRETASRLLHELSRPFSVSVRQRLQAASSQGEDERQRIHALWLCARMPVEEGIASLLRQALVDPSPRVREHAAMMAIAPHWDTQFAAATDEGRLLFALCQSDDARVRLQAAIAMSELNNSHRQDIAAPDDALRHIWHADGGSVWMQRALFSYRDAVFAGTSSTLQVKLLRTVSLELKEHPRELNSAQLDFLEALAGLVARRLPEGARQALRLLDSPANHTAAMAVLYGAALESRKGVPQALDLNPENPVDDSRHALHRANVIAAAVARAGQSDAPLENRLRAIRLVGLLSYADAAPVLDRLLDAQESTDIQVAAIRAFANFPQLEIVDKLLERWPQATPNLRRGLLDVLLARREFAEPVLAALEQGNLTAADFDNINTERLIRICSTEQRPRAEQIFSRRIDANRAQVVTAHLPVLELNGDAGRGSQIFVQNCRTCHAIQGQGNRIGPDLASVARRPAADILVEILDPSRNVAPDGMNHVVVVRDGRVLAGLLAGENAESISLRRADGEDSISRADIEELRNTGRSLMPEGFEKNLPPQAIADLLAFLKKGEPAPP